MPEVETQQDGVLVPNAECRVEIVTHEDDISGRRWSPGVDPHPHQGKVGVRLHDQPAMPLPATKRLESQGVVAARPTLAPRKCRHCPQEEGAKPRRQSLSASTKCHNSTAENSPNLSWMSRSVGSRKIQDVAR